MLESASQTELRLINPFERPGEARRLWLELCEPFAASVFLTWGWVGAWLASLPPDLPLKLAVASVGAKELAAFFICPARVRRRGLWGGRGLYWQSLGRLPYDDLFVEYNGLAAPDPPGLELAGLLSALPGDWDELHLPGLDASGWLGRQVLSPPPGYRLVLDKDLPSPYVDLELVREKKGGYLSLLGSKNRAHIRRSTRYYEENYGPVALEAPDSLVGALELYKEMAELHEKRWREQGQSGAFAGGYQHDFHRAFIEKNFASGRAQLIRVRAGERTICAIYNLVHQKRVCVYNFGARFEDNKRIQPGLVAHALAIVHNAGLGMAAYDFLGGDSYYKLHLSTHQNRLVWARLQKPRLKFKLENGLRAVLGLIKPRAK